MTKLKRLLFFVADLRYFCSHRLHLAQAAARRGYEVWVMAPRPETPCVLPKCIHIHVLPQFQRSALRLSILWKERRSIVEALRIISPDILHNVGMKPIIFGTAFVHATCGVINDFGGLGYTFTPYSKGHIIKKFILRLLFHYIFPYILRKKRCVILCQNHDDARILKYYAKTNAPVRCIQGSGVAMSDFCILPFPTRKPWRLLFAARLLKEKGLEELIQARHLLKNSPLEIWVCGDVDLDNPTSFTTEQIRQWHKQKIIYWIGFQKDLKEIYAQVHGAVLPSYREGLPRSLIEAAAWGKPIITTRVPGCQDVVVEGKTGYLANARDAKDLARVIDVWIHDEEKEEKGKAGHAYVQMHFSTEAIHPKIFSAYQEVQGEI